MSCCDNKPFPRSGCRTPTVPSSPKQCAGANNCCTELPAPPCTASSGVSWLVYDHAVKEYQCASCSDVAACLTLTMAWQSLAVDDEVWDTAGPGQTFFQVSTQWGGNLVPASVGITHVYITGTKLAAGAGSATLGTLPLAMRPTVDRLFPCVLSGGVGTQTGYVSVAPSGQVSVSDTGGASSWQSVDASISFPVSGP